MEMNVNEHPEALRGLKNPLNQLMMRWGLYFGAFGSFFSMLFAFTKTSQPPMWVTTILYIGNFVLMALALRAYKRQYDGYFKYSRALRTGTIISLYAMVVAFFLASLTYYVLAPDYLDFLLGAVMDEIARHVPEGSQAYQVQETMMKMVFKPWIMTLTAAINIFLSGFVAALITSIFERERNPEM